MPAPRKMTVTAARNALNAVEGGAERYTRDGDTLSLWADDSDAREREEIIVQQAMAWLDAHGYDTTRAGLWLCGSYVGLRWNTVYSATAELAAQNID